MREEEEESGVSAVPEDRVPDADADVSKELSRRKDVFEACNQAELWLRCGRLGRGDGLDGVGTHA